MNNPSQFRYLPFLLICIVTVVLSCEIDTGTTGSDETAVEETGIDPMFEKYFLYEAIVRTSCGFSPQAEYMIEYQKELTSRKMVALSYHKDDAIEVEGIDALFEYMTYKRFGGIPQLYGMRTPIDALRNPESYSQFSLGLVSLQRYYEEDLPALVSQWSEVAIQMEITGRTSRGILVSTRLQFREIPQGKLHYTLVLKENELPPATQNNHMNDDPESPFYQAGSPLTNYVHRNVVRAFGTPSLGLELPMPDLYEKGEFHCVLEIPIKEDWNLQELQLVGFVHRYSPEPYHKEVYNVRAIPVEIDQGFAQFLSFGFKDVVSEAVLTDKMISVTVPYGTDTAALTAEFLCSDGPVMIGEVPQISGESVNDFQTPLVYTIGGTDEFVREVTVEVLTGSNPLPEIETTPVVDNPQFQKLIGGSFFTVEGRIVEQGDSAVTEYGICWSNHSNPLYSDHYQAAASINQGIFSVYLTSMVPDQTYYLRAYGINSEGIGYGEIIQVQSGKEFGESFGGGRVFYNDGRGSVLVASEEIASASSYSNVNLNTGLTGTGIGSGALNSQHIVSQQDHSSSAAQLCLDWSFGGYADWFLPSITSLERIYQVLARPGFVSYPGDTYWSSSENSDSLNLSGFYFFSAEGGIGYGSHGYPRGVIAVRKP